MCGPCPQRCGPIPTSKVTKPVWARNCAVYLCAALPARADSAGRRSGAAGIPAAEEPPQLPKTQQLSPPHGCFGRGVTNIRRSVREVIPSANPQPTCPCRRLTVSFCAQFGQALGFRHIWRFGLSSSSSWLAARRAIRASDSDWSNRNEGDRELDRGCVVNGSITSSSTLHNPSLRKGALCIARSNAWSSFWLSPWRLRWFR